MSTTHDHEQIISNDPAEPASQEALFDVPGSGDSNPYPAEPVVETPQTTAGEGHLPAAGSQTPTEAHPSQPQNPVSEQTPQHGTNNEDGNQKTGFLSTRTRKAAAIGTLVAVVGGGIGTAVALGGSSSPRHETTTNQNVDPSSTQLPSPNATNSASQKPSTSPTPTSIPTATETTPATNETTANPGAGSVDLVTRAAGESVIHFDNDSVGVLTATISGGPKEIANAWLSQYAYLLYRGAAPEGYANNIKLVEAAMTSDQTVLSSLQTAIDNWRTGVGTSGNVMPIFWDSPSNPADFTQSTDSAGNTVITLSENGGPLYLNTYDPSAPWNNPSNNKWQDTHGRNVAKATKISSFSLIINGTNQDGLPNIIGWKLLS